MNKGGYQIINLQNKKFINAVSMVIDGIYDKIEGSIKPIYLSGITIDGSEYHDLYVVPTIKGSSYVFNAYGYTFEISDIDVVTVTKDIDIIAIEPNIETIGYYYDVDEDTYNKLTNITYDSIPKKIDITYDGKRHISTVLSFDGNHIYIVVGDKVVVSISWRYVEASGKYQIGLG